MIAFQSATNVCNKSKINFQYCEIFNKSILRVLLTYVTMRKLIYNIAKYLIAFPSKYDPQRKTNEQIQLSTPVRFFRPHKHTVSVSQLPLLHLCTCNILTQFKSANRVILWSISSRFPAIVTVGGHDKKKLCITDDSLQLLMEQLVSAFNKSSGTYDYSFNTISHMQKSNVTLIIQSTLTRSRLRSDRWSNRRTHRRSDRRSNRRPGGRSRSRSGG